MEFRRVVRIAVGISICLAVGTARADDPEVGFGVLLGRVDEALKTNPSRVTQAALQSCLSRRNYAVQLYDENQLTRARRGLRYCFDVLDIREPGPEQVRVQVEVAPSIEEVQAQAAAELERAIELTPDPARGLEIYRSCAMCHGAEGFGLWNGSVPQIAGQHRSVVIKQLADIRAGHRQAPLMLPYATIESIGGAQAVADVAGYIDTLEIGIAGRKGPGDDLALGERLYVEQCVRCHGVAGEGSDEERIPRIQSQQYRYLVRQFEAIRDGRRANANAEMAAQIRGMEEKELQAVLDYVSRIEPPAALQAPEGWKNPDFSH